MHLLIPVKIDLTPNMESLFMGGALAHGLKFFIIYPATITLVSKSVLIAIASYEFEKSLFHNVV